MNPNIIALVAGLVFGAGLILSGMTQPEKVTNFLDFSGTWDPSLAFVMGGAILVHGTLLRIIRQRGVPVFDEKFHLPTIKDVDRRLVLGAAIFGIGWGLGGYCPGPGIVSTVSGSLMAGLFVVSMLGGMWLQGKTS
jgi:uncharacterized membrane protein YedE/YeeE